MSKTSEKTMSSTVVTGTLGATSGAAVGAAVGSVFGPVGAVTGALVGSAIGAAVSILGREGDTYTITRHDIPQPPYHWYHVERKTNQGVSVRIWKCESIQALRISLQNNGVSGENIEKALNDLATITITTTSADSLFSGFKSHITHIKR